MRGVALILGGAARVWDDLAKLEEMTGGPWEGPIIACNEMGADWPRHLDHWVTYHPENFWEYQDRRKKWGGKWLERRALNGFSGDFTLWAPRGVGELDRSGWGKVMVDREVLGWHGGSSGLLSVAVAEILRNEGEVERGVLCGIPLVQERHYHDRDSGRLWKHSDSHFREWLANVDKMYGWVRSMSGRTTDLLGEPSPGWLSGSV